MSRPKWRRLEERGFFGGFQSLLVLMRPSQQPQNPGDTKAKQKPFHDFLKHPTSMSAFIKNGCLLLGLQTLIHIIPHPGPKDTHNQTHLNTSTGHWQQQRQRGLGLPAQFPVIEAQVPHQREIFHHFRWQLLLRMSKSV